jgi:hypothetical protein
VHTGKELDTHKAEKGRLGCDSDAPQVGSARSDWARVVNVNHRKTNRRKTRPYRTINSHTKYRVCEYEWGRDGNPACSLQRGTIWKSGVSLTVRLLY